MNLKEYQKRYNPEDAVGWDCIDQSLATLYPAIEPRHYAPILSHSLGGEDPLDGISVYDSQKQTFHRHIISYGMSELFYEENAVGNDFSKWGFEFTFRLKSKSEEAEPLWVNQVMNNLARYVFNSGKWFEEYHFVPANGPINLDYDTDIVGLAFCKDEELGAIQTPHGEVVFLQMVGITSKEVERLKLNPSTHEVENLLAELRKTNPLLITDLNRTS